MSSTTSQTKGVTIQKVQLSDIFVDEQFQRPVNERFVMRIVDEFDSKMLGVLVCNKRYDGTYSITDGHHRLEALKRLGRKQATCVVFEINAVDEGALFAALQKNRRPVTAIEQHKALVFSREPLAVSIERATNAKDFKVSSTSVSCINAIRKQLERGWKIDNYSRTLTIIDKVWGKNNKYALQLASVMGLWMFLERAQRRATIEECVDAFMDLDARILIRDAKSTDAENVNMGMQGSAGWVLAQRYNKFHRKRGAAKIEMRLFTNSFRTSLGQRTRKANAGNGIDTSGNNSGRFETPDPLSYGDS